MTPCMTRAVRPRRSTASARPGAGGGSSIDDQKAGYTVVSVKPSRVLLGMLPAFAVLAALAPITAAAVNVSPLDSPGPHAGDIVSVYTTRVWIAAACLGVVGARV